MSLDSMVEVPSGMTGMRFTCKRCGAQLVVRDHDHEAAWAAFDAWDDKHGQQHREQVPA